MPEKVIDCTGLACPKPVLRTKEELEGLEAGSLVVVVDNEAAKSNVRRFAESQGCAVEVEDREGGTFALKLTRVSKGRPISGPITCDTFADKGWTVVLRSDLFGQGDEALGRKLMDAFLHTLVEVQPLPETVILYNRGALLAVSDGPFADAFHQMEKRGVRILICGTCLDHYGVRERVTTGKVSNMYEILETIARSPRTFTP